MYMQTVRELREFLADKDGDLPVRSEESTLYGAELTAYDDADGTYPCIELEFID